MKKCGKLKTLSELKSFWEQMLTPLQSKCQHDLFNLWPDREEEEEDGETNSWAITASKPEANVRQ